MSIDLEAQVRAYAQFLESTLPAVASSEVAADEDRSFVRDPGDPSVGGVTHLATRRRRAWVAASTAAVVAILGGFAWAMQSRSQDRVVTEPATTVTTTDRTAVSTTAPAVSLSITWTEEPAQNRGINTVAGRLRIDDGQLQRWVDGTRWEHVPALVGVTVGSEGSGSPGSSGGFADGGDFVLVSGVRQSDGAVIMLKSADGEEWNEIDISALTPAAARQITATSSSGVTAFGDPNRRPVVGVVEGDRVTNVHIPPWTPGRWIRFLEFDGTLVAHEDTDGKRSTAQAWRHLGGENWSPPEPVPFSSRIVALGDTVLMLRNPGGRQSNNPPVAGQDGRGILLTSVDGIAWTPHSILDAETDDGVQLASGDFFWVYGLGGLEGGIERHFEFDTIHVSPDAISWTPVDISFTDDQSFVQVSGDSIIVSGFDDRGTTWVGRVEATPPAAN